jgi:hypothetical protein
MKSTIIAGLLLLLLSLIANAQQTEFDLQSEESILRNKEFHSEKFADLKRVVDLAVADAELTRRISPLEISIGILVPLITGISIYGSSPNQGKFLMFAGPSATGLTVLMNEIYLHRLKKAEALGQDDYE